MPDKTPLELAKEISQYRAGDAHEIATTATWERWASTLAAALIEQMTPVAVRINARIAFCGKCGDTTVQFSGAKFCHNCGVPIKWT